MLKVRFEADCEAVARTIEPTGTSSWLTEYFKYWAAPLGSEWSIALMQPTRAKLKGQLASIVEAANVLDEALSDVVTTAFLERQHGFAFQKKFADLHGALRSLRNYPRCSD